MTSNDGRQVGGRDEGGDGATSPYQVRDDWRDLHIQAQKVIGRQPSPALARATGRRICRMVTLLADDVAQQLAAHLIDTDAPAERR